MQTTDRQLKPPGSFVETTIDKPEEIEDVERTFDPRALRANYSLFPLEHLNFCEECQQLRCPRCTTQEILCWYCPNCLFEMPTSVVKSEGGRCARGCYSCPICVSPLAISSINPDVALRGVAGPYILSCAYCQWSSLDIGWRFDKPIGIPSQVAKLQNDQVNPATNSDKATDDVATRFANLRTFYKSQLNSADTSGTLMTSSGTLNYSSPASIARIMNLYAGKSSHGRRDNGHRGPMCESANKSQGLHVLEPQMEEAVIRKMQQGDWHSMVTSSQQAEQLQPIRFQEDLKPMRMRLITKRSKRCRACRHILVKPEPKVASSRYKLRLVAPNYITSIHLKILQPAPNTSSALPSTGAPQPLNLSSLSPFKPSQFLLTLKNPLYDKVRVSLATPAITPGQHQHRVTILCPEFTIGAKADAFAEALAIGKERDSSKVYNPAKTEYVGLDGGRVAEAGKVWDKGASWTSTVLEVVCSDVYGGRAREALAEDEDVLEIPLYIRMEWNVAATADNGASGLVGKAGDKGEERELAFWVVLGIGRVAPLGERR